MHIQSLRYADLQLYSRRLRPAPVEWARVYALRKTDPVRDEVAAGSGARVVAGAGRRCNLLGKAEKYRPEEALIAVEGGPTGGGRGQVSVNGHGAGIGARRSRNDLPAVLPFGAHVEARRQRGHGAGRMEAAGGSHVGEVWARAREGGGPEVGFTVPEYEEQEA